jgi:hypothetical protein
MGQTNQPYGRTFSICHDLVLAMQKLPKRQRTWHKSMLIGLCQFTILTSTQVAYASNLDWKISVIYSNLLCAANHPFHATVIVVTAST